MTTFKQYIAESVKSDDVYLFYALLYILTAGKKFSMDEADLYRLNAMYNTVLSRLTSEIIAESIVAIASEVHYVWHPTHSQGPAGMVQPIIPGVDSFDALNLENWPSDLYDHIKGIGEFATELTEQFFMTGEFAASDVVSYVENGYGSVGLFLFDCIGMFDPDEMVWANGFGGKAWMKIAEESLAYYKKEFTATSNDLDHMLDLIHNGGNWLNKFSDGSAVKKALDIKRNAATPHAFKDHIHDPFVRKMLGKSLIGVEKSSTIDIMPIQVSAGYCLGNGLIMGGAKGYGIERIAHTPPSGLGYIIKQFGSLNINFWFDMIDGDTKKRVLLIPNEGSHGGMSPSFLVRWVLVPIVSGENKDGSVNMKFSHYPLLVDYTGKAIQQLLPAQDTPLFSMTTMKPDLPSYLKSVEKIVLREFYKQVAPKIGPKVIKMVINDMSLFTGKPNPTQNRLKSMKIGTVIPPMHYAGKHVGLWLEVMEFLRHALETGLINQQQR